jgi:hypothetical protein
MKRVGDCLYAHRTVVRRRIPWAEMLAGMAGAKGYDYAKVDLEQHAVTFTWCRGWDSLAEPVVERQLMVRTSPRPCHGHGGGFTVRELPVSKDNPPIIHGKHLFVGPAYRGFDIQAAKARWESYQGARWVDKTRMGRLQWWREHAIPRIGT